MAWVSAADRIVQQAAPSFERDAAGASRGFSRWADQEFGGSLGQDVASFGQTGQDFAGSVARDAGDAGQAAGGLASRVFETIKGVVSKILPDETGRTGLPHQRFVLQETAPQNGALLQVDNDLTYGTRVPNLQPGEPLTIRGVGWHDPNGEQGIHWTHKADNGGPAGYIQTPDGKIYQ